MSGNEGVKPVPRADELRELLKVNKQKLEDMKKENINKVKRGVDQMIQSVKEKLIAGKIISEMNYFEIPGFNECESKTEIVDYIGSLGFDVTSNLGTFNWK